MKHLENYYRNLCEQLQQQIAILEAKMKDKKKDKKDSKKSSKKEKMADKDYDGDGEVESSKDEYFGSKDKAIKKKMAEKKKMIKEGREVHGGIMNYGGFPRILNEVKYDIPAKASDIEGDLGAIGIDEFEKLMKSGSHPLMAGQTENGQRGVPQKIRDEALMHINKLNKHPQGKVEGYGSDHPIYQEAKAAHAFFTQHFPAFGVEDQIAQDYNLS
jgi:hypothetical protein